MDPNTTPAPAPAITAHPDTAHHARLDRFLSILERFGVIALTVAPAIAAPLVHDPRGAAILAAETPIAQALAQTLAAEVAQK